MFCCIVGFMWLPSYLFKPFHNKTRRDIEDCKYLQSPYFSLNPKIILLRTENGSTMPQIFFGRKLITNSIIWVDEIPWAAVKNWVCFTGAVCGKSRFPMTLWECLTFLRRVLICRRNLMVTRCNDVLLSRVVALSCGCCRILRCCFIDFILFDIFTWEFHRETKAELMYNEEEGLNEIYRLR